MQMGSTGTLNVSQQMMNDVLDAVTEYRGKSSALYNRLNETVNGLIPSGFSGNAADGFKDFYTKNIVPAVDEGLTQLLDAIDSMANGVLEAIPGGNGLDDQLADGNRQTGSQE